MSIEKKHNFGIYNNGAFTLIELLVVISIISLLMSVLIPALSHVRSQAKAVFCLNNLNQLGISFQLYANDYDEYAIPNYDTKTESGSQIEIYWWGEKLSDGINHKKAFTWPYLQSGLKKNSVYECPAQRLGTYTLQGKPDNVPNDPKWITSTYGYNGYYLCPPKSPWSNIRHRPWQKITTVVGTANVIAFADAMLDWDYTGKNPQLENNAMVDPPYLLASSGMYWQKNLCPTTCFRHSEKANVVFVDGHCAPKKLEDGEYTSPKARIGSISENNAPYYVPDYQNWTGNRQKRSR